MKMRGQKDQKSYENEGSKRPKYYENEGKKDKNTMKKRGQNLNPMKMAITKLNSI